MPIIRVMQRSEVPGGAGNVAANLAGLGCHMTLAGIIADDPAGRSLQHIFDSIGVGHRLVTTSSHPTITKTRVMSQNQQLLRIDEEEVALPSRSCREEILLLLEEILPKHNAVILSDYGKGVLHDPALVQRAIQLAGECGIPVLVDPKGKDWSRYRGATCELPTPPSWKPLPCRIP